MVVLLAEVLLPVAYSPLEVVVGLCLVRPLRFSYDWWLFLDVLLRISELAIDPMPVTCPEKVTLVRQIHIAVLEAVGWTFERGSHLIPEHLGLCFEHGHAALLGREVPRLPKKHSVTAHEARLQGFQRLRQRHPHLDLVMRLGTIQSSADARHRGARTSERRQRMRKCLA